MELNHDPIVDMLENQPEQSNGKRNKSGCILWTIAIVVMVFFGSISRSCLDEDDRIDYDNEVKENLIHDILYKAAVEINRKTPITVSEGLILDSCKTKYRSIIYYYSFPDIDYDVNDYNSDLISFIDSASIRFRRMALIKYRNAPEFREFRKQMVTMIYVYKDYKGIELVRISIDPDDME